MADIEALKNALVAAHNAGDTEAANLFASEIKAAQSATSMGNPNVADRQIPTPGEAAMRGATRGLATAIQGPTFGFGDEITAAVSAPFAAFSTGQKVGDVYRSIRDSQRRAVEEERKARPVLSALTGLAAGAPTMAIGGAATYGIKGAGVLSSAGRGAASGATFGGISGLGESESDSILGSLSDAAKGAAISAGIGAGTPVVGATIRGVGKALPDPISEGIKSAASQVDVRIGSKARRQDVAGQYAREKVAQNLVRDLPGQRKTVEEAVRRGGAVGSAIGQDAKVVDVGGESTRRMLDVLSSLPGKTANRAARVIRERQMNQGREIGSAAERIILGRKSNYADDLAAAEKARSEVAKPLYDQLKGVRFDVDDDLASILNRAEDYVQEAAKRAKVRGESDILKGASVGQKVSLDSLNTLKSTLFDAAKSLKQEGKRGAAAELLDLRIALKNKIDDLSPKDADGRSIARMADELWGGAEQYRSAIEAGRKAMRMDDISLADEMRGMSAAELEGFQIGAVQAIKSMAGEVAGRNKLLRAWKEDATGGKLRALFGGNYKEFQKVLAVAEKKKGIESAAGRGSQTMPREYARQDLDQSATMAQEVKSIAAPGAMSILDILSNRARTPEPVRDEMGRILLGPTSELPSLLDVAERVNKARAQRAASAGAFAGGGLLPLFQ